MYSSHTSKACAIFNLLIALIFLKLRFFSLILKVLIVFDILISSAGTPVPIGEEPYNMAETDHLKIQILEALDCTQDADLLDLILKLLIAEG